MSVWRDRVGFDLGPYGREGGNIMFSLPIMSRFSSRSLNRSSMFRFLHWTFLRVIVIGGDGMKQLLVRGNQISQATPSFFRVSFHPLLRRTTNRATSEK
ncbi:hypothetical protein KCU60_g31, partial [Aureobasidium melanogenum]